MAITRFKMSWAVPALISILASALYAQQARQAPHSPQAHPGDAVKQEEHAALFDLVDDEAATHKAVASGAWGDRRTWNVGTVPGSGARVVIPKGRSVTVEARHDQARLDWLRVDGTLRFDPKVDTGLKVITLVGNTASTIEIGTEKERVHADKVARLILGDRGARDDAMRQRDPFDLGGGLLSHGRVLIHGTEYTSHATPASVPGKGQTRVQFATAPKGWKVGDRLLFPGLDRQREGRPSVDPWTGHAMSADQNQDEVCLLKALSADGKTVTLDRALRYQHGGIFGYAEAVPVGNLSRSVIVESENVEDLSRRGHVMFMHTQDVVIDSALFRELGRTNAVGMLTDPELKNGTLLPGTDANSRGRYALHFHLRWGATYKQQPFVVRNSAVDGSPKFGIVNHGGYGLVDDNVTYRVRGSHFFAENGSEIGRFRGNLAVRSPGNGQGETGGPVRPGKPHNSGGSGSGFWLQGGGIDVTDNIAIGHASAAFAFFPQSATKGLRPSIQEPGNPFTKGTPWERFDVFLAENLRDPRLGHGQPWIVSSVVPLHVARCVGLASARGFESISTDRAETLVLHNEQDLIEDCRFVWNDAGCPLGYSPGIHIFRNTAFIGSDPSKGPLLAYGIGPPNHVPGFLTLDNVTIDGYQTGCVLPARGSHVVRGGCFNGIQKLVVPHPWGGKLVVDGLKFGTMKGEAPYKINFAKPDQYTRHASEADDTLLYAPPGSNWARKLQPFEFVYNGQQVYHDGQRADAVPFDVRDKRWARSDGTVLSHGKLDGKTNQQLWEQYRLAIGGRVAPAELTPSPEIAGGSFGPAVPFDPPVEQEPSPLYYGSKSYERAFGKSSADSVPLAPRYMYNSQVVRTPAKGYVAHVFIDGEEYSSKPTDLVAGVNLIPIEAGRLTRYVVVGGPSRLPTK
jgi:G8 domain